MFLLLIQSMCECDSNEQLANDMADFFQGKVEKIGCVLEANRTTIYPEAAMDNDDIDKLSTLKPVTEEELKLLTLKTPSKSCQSDPVLIKINIKTIDLLAIYATSQNYQKEQ